MMWLLLTTATLAAAPTTTTPGGSSRVVALPLRDDGAGAELTNTATSLTAVALSKIPGLSVLSGDDIRAAADVEAQKQMLGCNESGCLAEIAQALGADRMVHGSVSKLGNTVVVTLSLFDAKTQAALGREVVQAKDVSTLPADIDAAVRRLTNTAAAPADAAAASSSSGLGTPLLIGGLVGAGVGAVAAGAGTFFALGARDVLADPKSSGGDKVDAQNARPLWAALTLGGAAVAVAGLGAAGAGMVIE